MNNVPATLSSLLQAYYSNQMCIKVISTNIFPHVYLLDTVLARYRCSTLYYEKECMLLISFLYTSSSPCTCFHLFMGRYLQAKEHTIYEEEEEQGKEGSKSSTDFVLIHVIFPPSCCIGLTLEYLGSFTDIPQFTKEL